VLICCERKVLLAAGWCWFGVREKYYLLDAANRVIDAGSKAIQIPY